ncbi:polyketide synthase [Auriculariales sp. MPI-PUGE-AT-0066]|nr:polyketide synthase [Auriculariales sp. MPI-PUGE-AT-0066]
MAAPQDSGGLGLAILGLGTQYPPNALPPSALRILCNKFYPDSPALQKVLSINDCTGIEARSSIATPDHPLVNQAKAPSISDIHRIFVSDGVPLAVAACRKALAEARVDPAQITHMVASTCTDSAHPGYDHLVARELGLGETVEKVLLHGVGCSGGLAGLRTAANLCLGHTQRGLRARILVVALEVSTTLVRSELDMIDASQETRIGVTLFSDCSSAIVLSNGIGEQAPPIYELLGWQHRTIPDTESDLGFDVDPLGWKLVLSPRVPQLTAGVLDFPPGYSSSPADFDWAMHPGGLKIMTGAEKALGITAKHMRASYDTYKNHGNSSSATIFSVLDRLRQKDMDVGAPDERPRDYVVGCAFGPGITVEMCMLKRNMVERPPPDPDESGPPAT